MNSIKNIYIVVFILGCVAHCASAVDLQISNTSDRTIWATARTGDQGAELVTVEPGAIRRYIENITPNDQLTLYIDIDGESTLWGKFRIVLGGQRNDPIDLTFAGTRCTGYELQDILGEPGEGGYNIQDLYVTPFPLTPCYFQRLAAIKLAQDYALPDSSK